MGALIEGSSPTAGAPDPARVLESFRLDGRTALVTGSSRGLGRTAAIALAAAGARVVLAARTRAGLQETAIEVARLAAPEPLLVEVDVRDPSQLEEAFERAGRQAGELHVLINNAGIQRTGPAAELSLSDWRDVLETNLTAAFAASQLFARQSHGGASIVNVASIASSVGLPSQVAYGASKAGLVGLTRTLALELAPRGVRVNAVAPGYFRTDMPGEVLSDPERTSKLLRHIPLCRVGEPAELAPAILFLASDASAYVTGAVLAVDGGYTAR